jgi:putative phage-type endonuclease
VGSRKQGSFHASLKERSYVQRIVRSDSPDWLAARRQGLGGSDVAAVLGLSRWRGPLSVWLDKLGERPDEPPSDAMWVGQRMEPVIRDLVVHHHPTWRVQRLPWLLRHDRWPVLQATCDYIVRAPDHDGPGVLECKSYGSWARDAFADGRLPPDIYCQVQHYLSVTGYRWGVLAAWVDQRLILIETAADTEYQEWAAETLTAWWRRHIIGREPPAVTVAELPDARRFVGLRVEEDRVEVVGADHPLAQAAAAYVQHKALAAAVNEERDRRESAVITALVALTGGTDPVPGTYYAGAYRIRVRRVTVREHMVPAHSYTRMEVMPHEQ